MNKRTMARGRCRKNASCGRQCALSSDKSHTWCICQEPGCKCKQCPPDARRESARMDAATWLLALGGMAGMWIGGV